MVEMESQSVYPEVVVVKTKNGKAWVMCCYCGKIHDHGVPTSGIHFRSADCDRGEYWFKIG